MGDYEIVIGMECHAQLATATKLFCRCPNRFGAPPNTLTCPICTGQPGVLPVLNEAALRLGIRAALALDAEVAPFSKFDRKHYFYPDLPKNFQISQYDLPFAAKGGVRLGDGSFVRLRRIHLEEDAGKAIHDRGEATLVDLNRAGVPLLEATTAVAEGKVRLNGAPYLWEADEMAYWLRESPADPGEVELERERVRFTYERA